MQCTSGFCDNVLVPVNIGRMKEAVEWLFSSNRHLSYFFFFFFLLKSSFIVQGNKKKRPAKVKNNSKSKYAKRYLFHTHAFLQKWRNS